MEEIVTFNFFICVMKRLPLTEKIKFGGDVFRQSENVFKEGSL